MSDFLWLIMYYLSAVFLVLTGVFLLLHKHPMAGGWTLAGGILMSVFSGKSDEHQDNSSTKATKKLKGSD